MSPLLCELLNGLVRGDPIPDGLPEACVSLLFKKGDPTQIENFRPISLLSPILKALTNVVLNRIENVLDALCVRGELSS